MFSTGMLRSCPPAANSVVNISERAVDNQPVSEVFERFLKPTTAIDGRGLTTPGAAAVFSELACGSRAGLLIQRKLAKVVATVRIATDRATPTIFLCCRM